MKARFSLVSVLMFLSGSAFCQSAAEPAHIPYESTTRILWGDEISGKVPDWRYHGGDKIIFQIFGMEPGQVFRHSDRFTTLFLVDAIYYVLSGTLFINSPATGEVIRVNAGELGFLARDHWNHGFAYSTEVVRVLEYLPRRTLGPKQPSISVSSYSPTLHPPKYAQDQWIGQWPAGLSEARRISTHQLVRDTDLLWRLEGEKSQVLVGIMARTDQITMGKITLQPGQETEIRIYSGDEGIYVEEGEVHVRIPEAVLDEFGQTRWFDVKQGDGVYLPEGTPHQYYNPSQKPTTLKFGVSPDYLPKNR